MHDATARRGGAGFAGGVVMVATPRVTLKQVAERAGVSPTTASFVLSGRRDADLH
jgi:hypothetical protein